MSFFLTGCSRHLNEIDQYLYYKYGKDNFTYTEVQKGLWDLQCLDNPEQYYTLIDLGDEYADNYYQVKLNEDYMNYMNSILPEGVTCTHVTFPLPQGEDFNNGITVYEVLSKHPTLFRGVFFETTEIEYNEIQSLMEELKLEGVYFINSDTDVSYNFTVEGT